MSNNGLPGAERALHEAQKSAEGEYPDGRLNDNDAGATSIAIGAEHGRVILRFVKPVLWLGLPPHDAMELAVSLMKHARNAGAKEPLVFRVG